MAAETVPQNRHARRKAAYEAAHAAQSVPAPKARSQRVPWRWYTRHVLTTGPAPVGQRIIAWSLTTEPAKADFGWKLHHITQYGVGFANPDSAGFPRVFVTLE